jgi:hypothetical protein
MLGKMVFTDTIQWYANRHACHLTFALITTFTLSQYDQQSGNGAELRLSQVPAVFLRNCHRILLDMLLSAVLAAALLIDSSVVTYLTIAAALFLYLAYTFLQVHIRSPNDCKAARLQQRPALAVA